MKGNISLLHDHNTVIFVGIFKTSYITVPYPQWELHINWIEVVCTILYPERFRYLKLGRVIIDSGTKKTKNKKKKKKKTTPCACGNNCRRHYSGTPKDINNAKWRHNLSCTVQINREKSRETPIFFKNKYHIMSCQLLVIRLLKETSATEIVLHCHNVGDIN